MFNSITRTLGLKKNKDNDDDDEDINIRSNDNSNGTMSLPSVPSSDDDSTTKKSWFKWSEDASSTFIVSDLCVPVASQEDYLPKNVKLMCRDCESIRLTFNIKHKDETIENEDSSSYEVEIRYKTTSLLSNSKKLRTRLTNTSKGDVIIKDLKSGTKYKIDARVRRIQNEEKMESWSKYSDSFLAETRDVNVQEQIDLARRTADWISGNLKPYPLVHKSDTTLAKAERLATGALNVAAWTGIGGMYAKIAKTAWQVKRMGVGAVVFRAELQKVVVAVASILNKEAKRKSLSHKDLTFGVYYMLWLKHASDVSDPEAVRREHGADVRGVEEAKTSPETLQELSFWLPLAWSQYRKEKPEQQWLLDKYPSGGGDDNFKLLYCSPVARKIGDTYRHEKLKVPVVKPAFSVITNPKRKLAVVAIRGTKSMEGFIVDFNHEAGTMLAPKDSDVKGVKLMCHSGMYEAARYLSDDVGVRSTLERLHASGYDVVICGHSLGAGVATLLGMHLMRINAKVGKVKVYGFATPPCVTPNLTTMWKDRLTVLNVVMEGDLVPLFSYRNCSEFAAEIAERRAEWEPMMRADIDGITNRAWKLWAPARRTQSSDKMLKEEEKQLKNKDNDETAKDLPKVPETTTTSPHLNSSKEDENNDDDNTIPHFVIPGRVVHIYRWRGTFRAATVNHKWIGLRRIETNSNTVEHHKLSSIMDSIREVHTTRNLKVEPPRWKPANISSTDSPANILCAVCGYDVSWHHTGGSATSTARATYHCRACGEIVCGMCSKNKFALPELGLSRCVRVCDTCLFRRCGGDVDVGVSSTKNNSAM